MFFWLCLLAAGDYQQLSARKAAAAISRQIATPRPRDGFWGIAVYAPLRDAFIFERHGLQNFRPASNLKILTTLLAFEYLGPGFTFETEFAYSGEIRDGLLRGDLIVLGAGDPSISGNYGVMRPNAEYLLGEVAGKVAALGIRRVGGDIRGVLSFFDDRKIQYSWEWDDIGLYYATPVGPLSLHDGWIDIHLATDESGSLLHSAYPNWTPGLVLQFDLTHEPGQDTVAFQRQWNTNALTIEGNLPPCSEHDIRISAWDPAAQFLETFKHLLEQRGIAVDGICRTGARPPGAMVPISSISSLCLADLSQVLMKHSQNHYADCFLKTIAKTVGGEGSFEQGARLASALLTRVSRWSTPGAGFSMRDGSGLSAQNYIQPLQIVELLLHGLNQPYGEQWLASFPLLGGVGTLRRRGNAVGRARGRVRAKTGYIFRSRSLSGYLRTLAGEPLLFAIMVNNYSVPTREIERIQDRICELLVRLRPNGRVRRRLAQEGSLLPRALFPGQVNPP